LHLFFLFAPGPTSLRLSRLLPRWVLTHTVFPAYFWPPGFPSPPSPPPVPVPSYCTRVPHFSLLRLFPFPVPLPANCFSRPRALIVLFLLRPPSSVWVAARFCEHRWHTPIGSSYLPDRSNSPGFFPLPFFLPLPSPPFLRFPSAPVLATALKVLVPAV